MQINNISSSIGYKISKNSNQSMNNDISFKSVQKVTTDIIQDNAKMSAKMPISEKMLIIFKKMTGLYDVKSAVPYKVKRFFEPYNLSAPIIDVTNKKAIIRGLYKADTAIINGISAPSSKIIAESARILPNGRTYGKVVAAKEISISGKTKGPISAENVEVKIGGVVDGPAKTEIFTLEGSLGKNAKVYSDFLKIAQGAKVSGEATALNALVDGYGNGTVRVVNTGLDDTNLYFQGKLEKIDITRASEIKNEIGASLI